jgi:hypothetical protein
MQREGRHICYLDEKWFYTTTRRKKLKYVPRQPYEAIGADYVRRRKVVSRRHSLKTMFIGVVAEANAEHEFDGKIMIERIAEDKVLRRATYRNQFHFDRHINDEIKSGGWKQLYPDDPNILTSEFIGIIANNYDLEEEVAERLSLRYNTYPRGEKRTVTLGQNEFLLVREITEENGARRALTVDDLTLIQRLEAGTIVQEDINCDSDYMLDVMPRIGAAIRQKMNWVPENEIIILVMDNAGGHGTVEAIEQYTRHLLENYRIQIIHQPA